MTGSALAVLDVVLTLLSLFTGEGLGGGGARLHPAEGRRMTGSAFAILSRAERCDEGGSAG